MAHRELRTLKVSEVPASVRDVYALRTEYTVISPAIQAVISTHMKGVSTGSTGFRDFSSLRSKTDSDGFQEVRRWGRAEGSSRHRPSISGTLSIEPSSPVHGMHSMHGRPIKKERTFEEAEKSKITGVINKISDSNYEKSKAFLSQFLDPDDTSVLTEFVNSVFETAAMSVPLCKTCTKLLHELGFEYPHVRIEMLRLFKDFSAIFDNIKNPCKYTGDHDEDFLQEQKQIQRRKGYSRFIAELLHLKVLPYESYVPLLKFIADSLVKHSTEEKYTEQCTAYAECLKILSKTHHTGSDEWVSVLMPYAKMANLELPPGLKPQAKYAILDIIESIAKGGK